MNYKGKLYGRISGTYFETGKTSEDWDALEERAKALEAEVLSLRGAAAAEAGELTRALQNLVFGEDYAVGADAKSADVISANGEEIISHLRRMFSEIMAGTEGRDTCPRCSSYDWSYHAGIEKMNCGDCFYQE